MISIHWVPPTTSQQRYMSVSDNTTEECIRDTTLHSTGNNSNSQGPIFASMMAAQSAFPSNDDPEKSDGITRHTQFDFCMTNPPFYSTVEEATLPRKGDSRRRTDMTLEEGFYPAGGEEAFVMDMIQDSLYFRNDFTWYTSMLGKKSSLMTIEKKLKDMGFGRGQLRTTSFIQGNSTRWGVAWTFRQASKRSPGMFRHFFDHYWSMKPCPHVHYNTLSF